MHKTKFWEPSSGLVTAISADSMALLDRLAELPHTGGLEGSTPLTALMAKWTQLNVKNIMIAEVTDLTHREQNAVSRFKQSLSEKIKVAYVQRTNAISIAEIIVHIHNEFFRGISHHEQVRLAHTASYLSAWGGAAPLLGAVRTVTYVGAACASANMLKAAAFASSK